MAPQRQFKATVLGAAGGIGQPLSLLLAQSPFVKDLSLFDVVPVVAGVGKDISHIETGVNVVGIPGSFKPEEKDMNRAQLEKALEGSHIVVIPAGVPRKPGMTRDDLFKINAGIVAGLIDAVADVCPEAMICIISNPVNSTVPIAAEVLKKKGKYDPKRLFGVSTLDIVRSNKFLSEEMNINPEDLEVEVIGGHSGVTILPLLSKIEGLKADAARVAELTTRIQNAGTEVVEAKAGAGSATLSMAYAGARFAGSVMNAMSGTVGVVECAYVDSSVVADVPFFATKVTLGVNGIEEVQGYGTLSDFEQEQLSSQVLPNLQAAITKGVEFVAGM